MRLSVHDTASRAASAAARLMLSELRLNPALVMGLPTGHTPIPLYRSLVRAHRLGRADFSAATTFNLDEFVGQGRGDAGSYRSFMDLHLFNHVNLRTSRTHLFDGRADDWRAEVARYERRIARAGGLDLIVLGIGQNGHLGFNEPAPSLTPRSHRVRLRQQSRRANASLFGGRWKDVPTHALSMGISTILKARRAVLIATGRTKAHIVARALQGRVTTQVPASLLQTHPDVTVFLDGDAAAELTGR